MKKLVLFSVLILTYAGSFAQSSMASCCTKVATEKFALFASDVSFVMSHEAPLPDTEMDAFVGFKLVIETVCEGGACVPESCRNVS